MFIFTGSWKDKMVSEKLVSADQLIEFFELPIDKDKVMVHFELNMENISVASKDHLGKLKWSPQRNIPVRIQGIYKRSNVDIQYYRQKVSRETGKGYSYTPTREFWKGKNVDLVLEHNLELIVLFMINPMCSISPFLGKKKAVYHLIDKEKRAITNLNKEKEIAALRDKILNGFNDAQVMAIAKGYRNRRNNRLDVFSHSTAVECRFLLSEELKADMDWLRKNISLPMTMLSGLVYDSVDKGYVRLSDIGGGRKKWSYMDDTTICEVDAHLQGPGSLVDYLVDQRKADEFQTKISIFNKGESLNKNMEFSLEVDPSAPGPVVQDDFTYALHNDLVTLDQNDMKLKSIPTSIGGVQICSTKTIRVIPEGTESWRDFIINDKKATNAIADLVKKHKNASIKFNKSND